MLHMTTFNRRDLCIALSSLVAFTSVAEGQGASGTLPATMPVPPPPGSPGDKVLSEARVFPFNTLPVAKTANGETRAVTRGVLPTGEAVEMHETTLIPGHMPHPPHKHRHSEFMMVREGTLEFSIEGNPQTIGPGGVMFAASDVTHGLKNIGTTPANYFVLAIGRES